MHHLLNMVVISYLSKDTLHLVFMPALICWDAYQMSSSITSVKRLAVKEFQAIHILG